MLLPLTIQPELSSLTQHLWILCAVLRLSQKDPIRYPVLYIFSLFNTFFTVGIINTFTTSYNDINQQ